MTIPVVTSALIKDNEKTLCPDNIKYDYVIDNDYYGGTIRSVRSIFGSNYDNAMTLKTTINDKNNTYERFQCVKCKKRFKN